ncbi:MAG: hypothetical protein R3B55_03855 [Candidatus Paceibacterota bacterium]
MVVVKDINDIFKEKEKMKRIWLLWEDNYIAPDTSFIYKLEGGRGRKKNRKTFMLFLPGHFKINHFILQRDYFLARRKIKRI